jgi:hypothetical protein
VSFVRRFRWALLFLVGLVVIGAGASSVLAGSQKASETTYWNNAIHATTSGNAGAWIGYGQAATFTFSDVSSLYRAMDGTVFLNFSGLSKSIREGGGGGYATTVNVKITGVGTVSLTTTLANPWRPHVAFSNNPEVGWNAYGAGRRALLRLEGRELAEGDGDVGHDEHLHAARLGRRRDRVHDGQLLGLPGSNA